MEKPGGVRNAARPISERDCCGLADGSRTEPLKLISGTVACILVAAVWVSCRRKRSHENSGGSGTIFRQSPGRADLRWRRHLRAGQTLFGTDCPPIVYPTSRHILLAIPWKLHIPSAARPLSLMPLGLRRQETPRNFRSRLQTHAGIEESSGIELAGRCVEGICQSIVTALAVKIERATFPCYLICI